MANLQNIDEWLDRGFNCSCGKAHFVPLKKVVIERGALLANTYNIWSKRIISMF